jgi:hypothetical protein
VFAKRESTKIPEMDHERMYMLKFKFSAAIHKKRLAEGSAIIHI